MSNLGWDLDNAGSGGAKKEFTKFPVGVTRIRVLDSAPLIRWVHWLPKFQKSVTCPGMKICPIDDIIEKQKANGEEATYSRSRKYAINIFNYETGKVEIMEQGKTFFEDLKLVMQDATDEGKQLSDWVLKVRRTGTGREDTKYRIDKLEDASDELPTEGVTDLTEYFKPHTPDQITRLLAVTDNHKEAWVEIMTETKEADGDENIEIK